MLSCASLVQVDQNWDCIRVFGQSRQRRSNNFAAAAVVVVIVAVAARGTEKGKHDDHSCLSHDL